MTSLSGNAETLVAPDDRVNPCAGHGSVSIGCVPDERADPPAAPRRKPSSPPEPPFLATLSEDDQGEHAGRIRFCPI
jgi:hypothetical protein